MSENEAQIQVETQGVIEPSTDGLTEFLNERDNKLKKVIEEKEIKTVEAKEAKNPEKKEKVKSKEAAEKSKETPKKKVENIESEDDDDESAESKAELEIKRLNKMLADSKKWGHSNSSKNKAALRHAQALLDDDILPEEHFKRLSDLLQIDESEEPVIPHDESPLAKIIRVANTRVSDLAELNEEDELFTQKLGGFDLLIKDATEDEREDILKELLVLEKTPLKLAKKMYELGEKYYNEFYKDVEEVGGFKKYAAAKQAEVERLQKKIDKLEKKLSYYDSHDKPTHRIDELNEGFGGDEAPKAEDGLSQFLIERDVSRHRRRR